MANPRRLEGGFPDTHFQRWLAHRGACSRGRHWVGGKRADYTWKQFDNPSDMAWLIWKLTDGSGGDLRQEFFTREAGDFLATLAHRVGCKAVRKMVPWLPAFKYGEFQDWTKSQRAWLGSLAKPLPVPSRPVLQSDTAP